MAAAALALGTTAAGLYYAKGKWETRGMPPGPSGVPIFGNALQMDKYHPQLTLTDWGKEYGDVYSLTMMDKKVVVAHSYEAVKEVLITNSSDFAGRPYNFRMDYLNHFDRDNFSFGDYSERFIHLKKITLTSLKMYGDGLDKLEKISLEYIGDLLSDIEKLDGAPYNPRQSLKTANTNIITGILLGEKIDPKDVAHFLSWEPRGKGLMNPVGKGMELDMAPWLRYLPNETFDKLTALKTEYRNLWEKWIRGREEALKDTDDADCVIDKLLKRKYQNEMDANGKPLFNNSNMIVILQDLIIAGMATTSTALYCLIGLLATRPEVQKRMQEEVDDIMGDRAPSMADRPKTPYTEAALLELLRFLSHLPLALPHKATKDTTLMGYRVPKGTSVWPNIWNVHHDEGFWDKPYEFIPERYLDKNGELLQSDHPFRQRNLPFGAGRRVCMGETLAKNRLYLFATAMLQKFNIRPVEGEPAPECDPRKYKLQILLMPTEYHVSFQLRSKTEE